MQGKGLPRNPIISGTEATTYLIDETRPFGHVCLQGRARQHPMSRCPCQLGQPS